MIIIEKESEEVEEKETQNFTIGFTTVTCITSFLYIDARDL